MIFYFTGTGNSYAAAVKLQERLGGELIGITDCVQNEQYDFDVVEGEPVGDDLAEGEPVGDDVVEGEPVGDDLADCEPAGGDLAEGEPVGIVFPVYYGGLPAIVSDFLDHVRFSETPDYLYGVMTFGGNLMGAGWILEQKLSSVGLPLSAAWGVRMPANYAMLYEPVHEDAAKPILEAADARLDEIAGEIKARKTIKEGSSIVGRAISAAAYPRYDKARRTAPFHVNDKCVKCGVCAERCPAGAIRMIDGTPTWVKDSCVFCMSCVRCNAIQYGDKIEGRYRYRNPIFVKKDQ